MVVGRWGRSNRAGRRCIRSHVARLPEEPMLVERAREAGPETSIAGNRAIVDALGQRDPGRAEAAMRQHLDDVAGLIADSEARDP